MDEIFITAVSFCKRGLHWLAFLDGQEIMVHLVNTSGKWWPGRGRVIGINFKSITQFQVISHEISYQSPALEAIIFIIYWKLRLSQSGVLCPHSETSPRKKRINSPYYHNRPGSFSENCNIWPSNSEKVSLNALHFSKDCNLRNWVLT